MKSKKGKPDSDDTVAFYKKVQDKLKALDKKRKDSLLKAGLTKEELEKLANNTTKYH